MASSTPISDVVGAITAVLINVLLICLFMARLSHRPKIEYWLGIVIILGLVPLAYLFITGVIAKCPLLYFIQVGLMMAYLIVEVLVDYVLKIEFRQVPWLVVPYVTLFFAATGGMIGIASRAGKIWTIAAVMSFFTMTILSFVQRYITGQ
jgi:hypothetical protein